MSEVGRRRPAGLGRGLSALLGDVEREEPIGPGSRNGGATLLPVASISPHPDQPRRLFDEAALDELAASISSRGLLQPIVVRPVANGNYQIVAGERRWRAAQRAQLHEIPVVIRDLDEAETLELALIENVQREDLNAIEEAEGYARLIREFGHTQEALGKLVHKSRSHVSNLMRLLDLPAVVQTAVAERKLSMGHARALITAENPEALAKEVIKRDLSVRDTEVLARGGKAARSRAAPVETTRENADIEALERQLGELIGLKVAISHGASGGQVALHYSTLDQLDMICQRLSGEPI